MSDVITQYTIRSAFQGEVEKASGQKMAECYQCGKCSAGCPMVEFMDLPPSQVMRMIQLGERDKVLGCRTIWLCASCETCTTRCPQEVEIAHLMDVLREMSRNANKAHPEMKDITTFHTVFLETIRQSGRLFEVGLEGAFKLLRPRHAPDDLMAGMKMGLRGKLKLFPHVIKGLPELKRIFGKTRKKKG